MPGTATHQFDFIVKFEKEKGHRRQRVEKVRLFGDTGMIAWVNLLNTFLQETNTGRMVEVKCKVTPFVSSE